MRRNLTHRFLPWPLASAADEPVDVTGRKNDIEYLVINSAGFSGSGLRAEVRQAEG
jgi:hypothetical protein